MPESIIVSVRTIEGLCLNELTNPAHKSGLSKFKKTPLTVGKPRPVYTSVHVNKNQRNTNNIYM